MNTKLNLVINFVFVGTLLCCGLECSTTKTGGFDGARDTRRASEKLAFKWAELKIYTDPQGASVFLDDTLLEDKTPTSIRKNSGDYRLSIRHPDCLPEDLIVKLVGGDVDSILIELRPKLGVLQISTPKDANIRIFHQHADTSFLKVSVPAETKLPPGLYKAIISKDRYEDVVIEDISIKAGEVTKLENTELPSKLKHCEIHISVQPEGANIFLNEEFLDETFISQDLEVGQYQIRVEHPAKLFGYPKYLPEERSINVLTDTTHLFFIELKPNFETLEVLPVRPKHVMLSVNSEDDYNISFQIDITDFGKIELPSGRYEIELFSEEPFYENTSKNLCIKKCKEEITTLKVELPVIKPLRDKLVWVPAGRAKIGTLGEEAIIDFGQYFIGKYEVTVKEFREFVQYTGYPTPNERDCNWGKVGFEKHPMNCISYEDAIAYTNWLSNQYDGILFRLPTEAEWEKAARGPDGNIYPWGNKWRWVVNLCDSNCSKDWARKDINDGYRTTAPVGSFENSSPYGAYDVLGNVAEWCEGKVVRGGSFLDYQNNLQTYKPHTVNQPNSVGFRVVASSEK